MSEFDQDKYPDADVVRQMASGRWDVVIARLCPSIAGLISSTKRNDAMPCPTGSHNRGGDGFRLWSKKFLETGATICNTCGVKADGIATIMFVNRWSYPETLKAVYDELHGRAANPNLRRRELHIPEPTPRNTDREDAFAAQLINETWQGTVGLGHASAGPARAYLERRGLVPCRGPLADLRFHPALDYFEKQKDPSTGKPRTVKVGTFPALVVAVRQPDGYPVALRRIYLTQDGHKAPVSQVKKMTPVPSYRSLIGAATRLDPVTGPVLHTCEGIENGLAVRILMPGEPVWPAGDTNLLTHLQPPEGVSLVFIWEDYDKGGAGAKAGFQCSEHLREKGIRAIRVTPEFAFQLGDMKVDWNDTLQRYGADELHRHPVLVSVNRIARAAYDRFETAQQRVATR